MNKRKNFHFEREDTFASCNLFCDGGSRGNPGPSGAGFVVLDSKGLKIAEAGIYLGFGTNNTAEYHSLILGLEKALEFGILYLDIFMDSLLVVEQVNGNWNVKAQNLKKLHKKVINCLLKFKYWSLHHIPRRENFEADKLVNVALDSVLNESTQSEGKHKYVKKYPKKRKGTGITDASSNSLLHDESVSANALVQLIQDSRSITDSSDYRNKKKKQKINEDTIFDLESKSFENGEFFLFCDGTCRGNPGPSAIGYVLTDSGGKCIKEDSKYLGYGTINTAEYEALTFGIEKVLKYKIQDLTIYMDSVLVVEQINGNWNVRAHSVKVLHQHVLKCLKKIKRWSLKYISKSKNRAGALVCDSLKKFSNNEEDSPKKKRSDYLNRSLNDSRDLFGKEIKEDVLFSDIISPTTLNRKGGRKKRSVTNSRLDEYSRNYIKTPYLERQEFSIFCDGGCRGNPGPSAAAFIILDSRGREIETMSRYLGNGTNSTSEYKSLLFGVERSLELGIGKLHIKMNSLLVVQQVNGKWNVKAHSVKELHRQILNLLKKFDNWRLEYISKKENRRAAELVNVVLDSVRKK